MLINEPPIQASVPFLYPLKTSIVGQYVITSLSQTWKWILYFYVFFSLL